MESISTERNISLVDRMVAYASFFRSKVSTAKVYRRAYRNFVRIVWDIARKRYPIVGILKNNNSIVLRNETELAFVAYAQIYDKIHFDMDSKLVTLSYLVPPENRNYIDLKFFGAMESGDIIHVFFKDIYHHLPIHGKRIIDIGAQIGDSAIYFAVNGADKVVAVEPIAKNFQIATRNISLNDLSDKISVLWAACSNETIKSSSGLVHVETRISDIPVVTLGEIIKRFDVDDKEGLILKMDCEGYEYQIILSSEDETLRRFSHIQIEYHSGYMNLKNRLQGLGFKVSVTRPVAFRLSNSGQENMMSRYKCGQWQFIGYLYADNSKFNAM
jgi:FkbM family methyltransferase